MLIKEENEELVKMLKSNIDTLLEERGVVTYIKKLKAEIKGLEEEVREETSLRGRLEKLYISADAQLENSARENALLRSAVHDKENRLLELLEEQNARAPYVNPVEVMDSMVVTQASTPQPKVELRSRHSTFESLDECETPLGKDMDTGTQKKYIELQTERDMLARELERERRDRYAEARMHLQYANQLRKELQRTKQQLESRTTLFENELSKVQNKGSLRAILHAVWYTIFPDGSDEKRAQLGDAPRFSSPRPSGGSFPDAPEIIKGTDVVEETLV